MPLKRKIAVFCLVLFFAYLTSRYFKKDQRVPEASAKIRIETKYSDAGQSLLLTQAKGITQDSTLQELLKRLGRLSPSSERNQQQILEIRKHLQITQEGNTEIFDISVHHPDARQAREIASQLAQSFQAVELLEDRTGAEAAEAELERQAAAAREEINTLEQTFRKVQTQNKPSDIDTALASRLQEKQAKHDALAQTYTPAHPDMIDLENEIESLKLQIMDGPPIDLNAVKQAEQNLRDADARYRQLRQKADDLRLQKEGITGRVKIIEISSKTFKAPKRLNPFYLAAFGVILLLLIILRIVSR